MKKLIAIAVVFVLVAGATFAVELGGSVTGEIRVLQGDSGDDSKVTTDGEISTLRIDGSGEAGDGKFGGYFRFNGVWIPDGAYQPWAPMAAGNVWWKPIDQLKILIGSNGGDGYYDKSGFTGWSFYQTATNSVTMNGDNVWGGSIYGTGVQIRDVFYGGDDGKNALRLEIKPLDMLGINIMLPFIDKAETADSFKNIHAQADLNFDFGNIAFTYKGASGNGGDQPKVFLSYGGNFGPIDLNVGFSYQFPNEDDTANPLGIGVGVKYSADTFGVKFRLATTLAGEDKALRLITDVLPYFSLGDNLAAFVSVGLGVLAPDGDDAVVGWHFNPYLQIGEEWGAKFLAGFKVWSNGGDNAIIKWAVPIALSVGF